MFDLKTALLLIVAVINLSIGVLVYFKRRQESASLAFLVLTIGISFWALTNAWFQWTTDRLMGILSAMLSYYAGICIALPFYAFSRNFPEKIAEHKKKLLNSWLWLYGIIWGIILTIPGVTLSDVVYDPNGRIITGPGLYFHFFSIALFIFSGTIILWKKRKLSTAMAQRQINLTIIGCLAAAIAGIFCNLILPLFKIYNFVWLGPDFTLILVVCMAYAIIKHGLFNLRILTTEIFVALLGLVMLVELLRAATIGEIIIRVIIISFYLYIARQILVSIYEEIQAKEALRVVNDELQQVNLELQTILDAKTDFIHAASHQLRTPLTAIRGLLTMEYEGDYDKVSVDERKLMQRNVLTAVERLGIVVNDLLRAAELEQGMSGEIIQGDVVKLVEQSIETLRPNYLKKDLQIEYQKPTAALPLMAMREHYLQQVFLNLLDNAEKYSPPKGKVILKLSLQNDSIIFSIQDQGIGFSEEQARKLFTKFSRTDEAKLTQPNGSGLGLFIVKRIVEDHGGKVVATSQGQNQGATFTIILPINNQQILNK